MERNITIAGSKSFQLNIVDLKKVGVSFLYGVGALAVTYLLNYLQITDVPEWVGLTYPLLRLIERYLSDNSKKLYGV